MAEQYHSDWLLLRADRQRRRFCDVRAVDSADDHGVLQPQHDLRRPAQRPLRLIAAHANNTQTTRMVPGGWWPYPTGYHPPDCVFVVLVLAATHAHAQPWWRLLSSRDLRYQPIAHDCFGFFVAPN